MIFIRMELKTKNEYIKQIQDEFASHLVGMSVKLVEAVANEDFEYAAILRDILSSTIDTTAQTLEILLDSTYEEIKTTLTLESDYVFNELQQTYNQIFKQ